MKAEIKQFLEERFDEFKAVVRLVFTTWLILIIPANIIYVGLFYIGFYPDIISWLFALTDLIFVIYVSIWASAKDTQCLTQQKKEET